MKTKYHILVLFVEYTVDIEQLFSPSALKKCYNEFYHMLLYNQF